MKLARKEVELRYFADTKRRSDSFPTQGSGGRADYWEVDMFVDDVMDLDEC